MGARKETTSRLPLEPGTEVAVLPLGRRRGVIVSRATDGRYQVRVGQAAMWCRERDVEAVEGRRTRGPRRGKSPADPREPDAAVPPGRLDLHGLSVEAALARVIAEIDGSLLRGADRLEVVHGKGSGRIKEALHRRLAALPVVAAYRVDPANAGVTWIYFH